MSDFHVGQKVVCIDARPGYVKDGPQVYKGQTYTIKTIEIRKDWTLGLEDQPLVELNEVGLSPRGNPVRYGQWRFKPLEEKSDPISLLRALTPDSPLIEQGDKWDKRVPGKVKS